MGGGTTCIYIYICTCTHARTSWNQALVWLRACVAQVLNRTEATMTTFRDLWPCSARVADSWRSASVESGPTSSFSDGFVSAPHKPQALSLQGAMSFMSAELRMFQARDFAEQCWAGKRTEICTDIHTVCRCQLPNHELIRTPMYAEAQMSCMRRLLQTP